MLNWYHAFIGTSRFGGVCRSRVRQKRQVWGVIKYGSVGYFYIVFVVGAGSNCDCLGSGGMN